MSGKKVNERADEILRVLYGFKDQGDCISQFRKIHKDCDKKNCCLPHQHAYYTAVEEIEKTKHDCQGYWEQGKLKYYEW